MSDSVESFPAKVKKRSGIYVVRIPADIIKHRNIDKSIEEDGEFPVRVTIEW